MRRALQGWLLSAVVALFALPLHAADLTSLLPAKMRPKRESSAQLRADYIARLQGLTATEPDVRTVGSLWSPGAVYENLAADDKAHRLHDTVQILVSVQTTAAQDGSVNSQRQFATTSAISGLAGGIATHGTNPLLNAQSNTTLKGQGQTASDTTFSTSLAGEVIAVLANGNLVVEAERQIFMNNQHENVVIRGVARQDDISTANTIPSSALSSLEIEMKGKGIISDSVRSPNPLTRAVLWLFGF